MSSLGDFVRQKRVERQLTQAELGSLTGLSQQAIDNIEAGRTKQPRGLWRLAEALEVRQEELIALVEGRPAEAAPAGAKPPQRHGFIETIPPNPLAFDPLRLPKDIPVLGTAAGGNRGDFILNGETIDYVRRPPGLANARGVFCLYVAGTSMWPRFNDGEPIFVTAGRPPSIGDDVVIELHPEHEGEPGEGFVKRLKKRTPTKLVVEQFSPPQEIEYELADIKQIFRVIPLQEMIGI